MAKGKKITGYTGSATAITLPTSVDSNLINGVNNNVFGSSVLSLTTNMFSDDPAAAGAPWGATNATVVYRDKTVEPTPVPGTHTINWDGDTTGKQQYKQETPFYLIPDATLPTDFKSITGGTATVQNFGSEGTVTKTIRCVLKAWSDTDTVIYVPLLDISYITGYLTTEDETEGGVVYPRGVWLTKNYLSTNDYVSQLKWTDKTFGKNIEWDGDVTGKTPVIENIYKISDLTPSDISKLSTGLLTTHEDLFERDRHVYSDMYLPISVVDMSEKTGDPSYAGLYRIDNDFVGEGMAYIAMDNITAGGTTWNKGTYFMREYTEEETFTRLNITSGLSWNEEE